ncbi:cupin domain-containing protein [Amaricoccus solimangrovi]|uniref:DUF861 domain-containing protein n=1 Tax=Amaricoccus solimangrovi TaxID=2589815 RepID=A0A501WPW4_9RHOB|nr:cupin domain-containing protein [Amaricoccus solimangrovi]TPE50154.1 DUF861 domain-containing protein [Amaricoccus solimangrovi]
MPKPDHVVTVDMSDRAEPADAALSRVVAGSGVARLWNAFSDPSGRYHAGHWQAEPGTLSVDYAESELCVLLEGRVRLTDATGTVEYGPGEAFVVAAGFRGTWESIGRVTKIYAILMPEGA